MAQSSSLKIEALRFSPGQDVKVELESYLQKNKIQAASILSAVGSLTEAHLRFANKKEGTRINGPLEIVSLSGTLGTDGSHIHLAVSDADGKTLGGHLLEGNKVFTTLELVLGIYSELAFKRTLDPKSGFKELEVVPVKPK